MDLLNLKTREPFRVRRYYSSRGHVRYVFVRHATLAAAERDAVGTKLGSVMPKTITYRATQVDVEELVKGHWSLVTRRNHAGKHNANRRVT